MQLPGGVAAGIRRFTIGSKEKGGKGKVNVKAKEERQRQRRGGDDDADDDVDDDFDLDTSIEGLIPPPQIRSLSAGYR